MSAYRNVFAQCPEIITSSSGQVCTGDTVQFEISDSTAVNVSWDFNAGDLNNSFSLASSLSSLTSVTTPRAISFVNHDGTWYGFTYNSSLSQLFRLDFANGIYAPPTALTSVSYSTASASISSSTWSSIKFYKENGIWYGFSVTEGNVLARIKFSNGLSSSSVDLQIYNNANGLALSGPQDLDLVVENDTVYLLVANKTGSSIKVYSCGASVLNTPILKATHLMTGFSSIQGLDIKYDCGSYYALINSINDAKVGMLSFGSSFLNTPAVEQLSTTSTLTLPMKSYLFKENDGWIGFIKHAASPTLTKIYFGQTLSSNPDSIRQFGSLNSSMSGWAFQVVEDSSSFFGFGINNGGLKNLYRIIFNENAASIPNSFLQGNQTSFVFESDGQYIVAANVTDSSDRFYRIFDTIQVLSSPGGNILLNSGICQDDTFDFLFNEDLLLEPIVNYSWTVNGNVYSDSAFSVSLSTADTQNAIITVTGANQCSAYFDTAFIVHPKPNLSFSIDTVCRAEQLTIINASSIGFDSISSFSWVFANDTLVGFSPEYSFLDTGLQQVKLMAVSNFGCVSDTLETVYVKDGPQAAFSVSETCLGNQSLFTSSPSSTVPYSVLWDLGDGANSTVEIFTHQYTLAGNYNVELIVAGNNGCSDTSNIQISVTPQYDANIDSIADTKCEFQAFSAIGHAIGSSNYSSYWILDSIQVGFGDTLEFTPIVNGTTNLSFVVNSGYSCFDTTSQLINLLRKPKLELLFEPGCAQDTLSILSTSSALNGQNINTHQWVAGAFSSQDSIFKFTSEIGGSIPVNYVVLTDSGCFRDTIFDVRFYKRPVLEFEFLTPIFCTDYTYEVDVQYTLDSLDTLKSDSIVISSSLNVSQVFKSPYNKVFFDDDGINYVRIGIETEGGCKQFLEQEIETFESPQNSLLDDTVCVNSFLQFSDQYSGSNYQRIWDFGDGNSSTLAKPQVFYNDTGTFLVSLQLIDKVSLCSDIDTALIKVLPQPHLRISDSTVCVNQSLVISLSEQNSNLDIYSANWYLNGALINQGSESAILLEDTGRYILDVVSELEFGCSSQLSKGFVVYPAPELNYLIDPIYGLAPLTVDVELLDDWNSSAITLNDFVFNDTSRASFYIESPQIVNFEIYVEDSNNCFASETKTLNFFNPKLDLAIVNKKVSRMVNFLDISIELQNLGNIPVNSAFVNLDVFGQYQLIDSIDQPLDPMQSLWVRFSGVNSDSSEFCARINAVNNRVDDNPSNDELCNFDKDVFKVISVFPNPINAGDQLNLLINKSDCASIQCFIYSQLGSLISTVQLEQKNSSSAIFELPLLLQPGIYQIILQCDDFSSGFKLVVY